MNAPSLRTVAVAVGFFGLTVVVTGAATAMTVDSSDAPVASAVTLDHADPTPGTVLATVAPAPPATAVEVDLEPIRCSDTGLCVAPPDPEPDPEPEREPEPEPIAAPEEAAPAPAETAPATPSPAQCELPASPIKADGMDHEEWGSQMHAWWEAAQAVARDCEFDRSEWREALRTAAWEDFQEWAKDHDHSEWGAGDRRDRGWGHDRGTAPERDGSHTKGGWGERDGWSKRDR